MAPGIHLNWNWQALPLNEEYTYIVSRINSSIETVLTVKISKAVVDGRERNTGSSAW
jgi:hypothetical protein